MLKKTNINLDNVNIIVNILSILGVMKLGTLITVKQLAGALAKYSKNIRILDSSWHSLATGRDPFDEYLAGHTPGPSFSII